MISSMVGNLPHRGDGDQNGNRRERQEGHHVRPAQDVPAGLRAENPGHLAAFEPGRLLPRMREPRGEAAALLIDTSLEAFTQPPHRLRPHPHHSLPGLSAALLRGLT